MVVMRRKAIARGLLVRKGSAAPCRHCIIAKASKNILPKSRIEPSEIPGERIFIDISSPKTEGVWGARHLLLIVDDCTDMLFNFFIKSKNLLVDKLVPWIKDLKSTYGITGEMSSSMGLAKRKGYVYTLSTQS